jgi:hypothetical protein
MSNQTNQSPLIKILKSAASLKLTVICLIILTLLVVWGTVYQSDHGLYQAQQKFFYSWFFLIFGFIPFPGTVLVMFVLFFNLVCSIFFRLGLRWSNIGNIITHTGIIVLLVGGFFTFYFSVESSLMLREGETADTTTSRHLWELAVWENPDRVTKVDVFHVDTEGLDPGDTIGLDELGLVLTTKEYYDNCSAFTAGGGDSAAVINAGGIRALKSRPTSMEISENVAGGVFDIKATSGTKKTLLLYGQDSKPTPVKVDNGTMVFSLRRKKIPMPLSITLLDFKVKFYPNSRIPKSYESTVAVKTEGGVDRNVVISMNKPLRHADLTFFQSGYYTAPNGTEYTILAVVKNFGRLLPYFSSIIIFLGMVIHFMVMLLKRRKKMKNEK